MNNYFEFKYEDAILFDGSELGLGIEICLVGSDLEEGSEIN